jgi:hypothetical protein
MEQRAKREAIPKNLKNPPLFDSDIILTGQVFGKTS